jgi:hypothetical protein
MTRGFFCLGRIGGVRKDPTKSPRTPPRPCLDPVGWTCDRVYWGV